MTAMSSVSKLAPAARAMSSRRGRTMWPASSAANSRTGPVCLAAKRRRQGTPAATATARSSARKDLPHLGSPPTMPTAMRQRERLAHEDRIREPTMQAERLVSKGYTGAEKALADNYAAGDVVTFPTRLIRSGEVQTGSIVARPAVPAGRGGIEPSGPRSRRVPSPRTATKATRRTPSRRSRRPRTCEGHSACGLVPWSGRPRRSGSQVSAASVPLLILVRPKSALERVSAIRRAPRCCAGARTRR